MTILRFQDIRVAARMLRKYPTAALLAVLSIAGGIGLTTGVFSMADALLLRPIAIDRPATLLETYSIGDDGSPFMYGWADYEDMRQVGAGIAEIAAYQSRGGMLANADGGQDLVTVSPVTPNFFPLVGVRAALGRASFDTSDGRPAAILGWRLWQRRFGGDPAIVGKTIVFSGKALTVAGVMPSEFGGLRRGLSYDVWVSTDAWFDVLERGSRRSRGDQFEFVTRLQPGITAAAAADRLDAGIRGPGKRKPAPAARRGTHLQARYGSGWTSNLALGGGLMAILALVLFVACANVAQLRLAQTEARRREIGIRKALGAGRGTIIVQMLVETAMLAIPGAVLGLGIASVLLTKAAQFVTAGQFVAPTIDTRVLAFTIAATTFSVLLASLSPARFASRLSVAETLKAGQGATGSRSGWRRTFLVAGQVAVSVAMIGGTLLFLTSLRNAAAIRPGFDTGKKLLVVNASPGLRLSTFEWAEQVSARLAALPGARAATFARRLPLSDSGGGAKVRVEMPGQAPRSVGYNNVAGNYFAVMGTRVLAGRGIDTNDRQQTPLVTVISESFAREFLPGRNPLGQSVRMKGQLWEVVGVAADAPANSLHDSPAPYAYFPYAQMPTGDLTLLLETAVPPAGLERPMTQAIKQFDSRSLLYGMTTLDRYMENALASDRLMSATAMALGLFSIALMAAGLFAALHYAIAQRTRELGLRVALGATPQGIRRLVIGESLRLVVWGVPVGLALLATLVRFARSTLVGVSPFDPLVYLGGTVAVVGIVLLASVQPARRATRIEPMDALRSE
jgi:putative ABC transport system permease protein